MQALYAEGPNGSVYFDGETLTVTKTGIWNTLTGNKGRTSIPVDLIKEIVWMPPSLAKGNGFILFVRADDPVADLRYGVYGRRDDYSTANADPLGCGFTRKQAPGFAEIRDAIQKLIGVEVVAFSEIAAEDSNQPMDFTAENAIDQSESEELDSELEDEETPAPAGSTYSEKLRMLTKLLQDGILTPEEFEEKLQLLDK